MRVSAFRAPPLAQEHGHTALARVRDGWINRAIPDAELDGFVANFVRRIPSFDSQAGDATKSAPNQTGCPARGSFNRRKGSFAEPCGLRQRRKTRPRP
jgi:hypothetical protein